MLTRSPVCSFQIYGDMWAKLQRAVAIWSGFGMTLTGVHTCGDYMFSGHTVVLTMLNFFVTECEYLFVDTVWPLGFFKYLVFCLVQNKTT